ncbi:MAG: nuclear transport factor 2 family protein [Woeseiaceae bacterium]|nr:nuclear transport factor 2 family protein [Woeseiaceae bacterium]
MKIMSQIATLVCLAMLGSGPAVASDTDDLKTMLQTFLAESSGKEAHAVFWADELVYTSSAGERRGKAEIMASYDNVDSDAEQTRIYTGEEVDIRVFGDTAIVAFKLVGTPTDKSADTDVLYYFNTGVFLKRGGVWKVIAWQATKIPPM